jgi:hypothetical protein
MLKVRDKSCLHVVSAVRASPILKKVINLKPWESGISGIGMIVA